MSLILALESARGELGIPSESPREMRSNCCLNKDAYLEYEKACGRRASFRPSIDESTLTLQIFNAKIRALGMTPMVDVEDYSRRHIPTRHGSLPKTSSQDFSSEDSVVFPGRGASTVGLSRAGSSTGQTTLVVNTPIEPDSPGPATADYGEYVGVVDPENGLIDGIWQNIDPFKTQPRPREQAESPPKYLESVEWRPEIEQFVIVRTYQSKNPVPDDDRNDSVRVSGDALQADDRSRIEQWRRDVDANGMDGEKGPGKEVLPVMESAPPTHAQFWYGDDEEEDEDEFNVEDQGAGYYHRW